jgi:hypothetical protein
MSAPSPRKLPGATRQAAPGDRWQARVPALWAQGLTTVVIAARLGVNRSSVTRVVRELGLREQRA